MYQEKNKIRKTLSAFAVIIVELALMAATTVVFVMAFEHVEAKNTEAKPTAGSSVPSSSAAQSIPSQTSQPAGQQFQQPDDWRLVLVNYEHTLPDTFESKIVHAFNVDMDSRIVEPFRQMRDAALRDDIHLWLSSGYRNDEKQQKLYSEEIEAFYKTGISYEDAVSEAARSVAPPGTSEHITGLAIDVNGVLEDFGGTKEFHWLSEHAQDYGFILRYPKDKQDITHIKYESWHFRYVGVEHAKKMKELNLCLEEYIDYFNKNQTASH
ncbi:M15 family metallopeptidase [Caproiciproducens sp. CPB-2]|uniref:M15 family metallopeptidase n=1 Tax=Caproiciproducens sp. CPB-2 TaxID=3030017 RepID=UPI0023DB14B5|nr:M15 family metallopeptidase [Caproiciproducens sp. CPB-2]MDF1496157.1 M15 family metallopeptidase [Caproiciproducens sp. CPB-2]